jgi:AcrR family transcriptional regulator
MHGGAALPDASPAPAKLSARERIFEVAAELFYREGIRAVGIDMIVARSGVAKMSLYRNFASKDDLVVAFLKHRNSIYWAWFDDAMAKHPDDPRRQVADLFASLARRVTGPRYRGCPFINTATEFPDPAHPARAICLANKRELRARLLELSTRLGARDPQSLADQFHLLIEGAYASIQTLGSDGPALRLPEAAAALVAAQLAGVADPSPSAGPISGESVRRT